MSQNLPALGNDFYAVVGANAARYRDKFIVIKFGGEIADDEQALNNLLQQVITVKNFGGRPILVHGGGKQITEMLAEAKIENKFIDGIRETSPEALVITERCLKALNAAILQRMVKIAETLESKISPIGRSAAMASTVVAEVMPGFDEGSRTGKITTVHAQKLRELTDDVSIPIFYPICHGKDGGTMNVNADDVAAAMARAIGAQRLILCSTIPGVLNKDGQVISELTTDKIESLIQDGTINNGMIPKIRAAADVANNPRVGGVVILDGRDGVSLTKELFSTEGAGTLIRRLENRAVPVPAVRIA